MDSSLVFLPCFRELSDTLEDDPEVVVQPALVCVTLEALLVDPDRLSIPAEAFQHRAEVVVGRHEGRIHGDGLLVVFLGLGEVSQGLVDIAEVVIDVAALGRQVDGALEMGDGLPVCLEALEDDAEVVVRLGVFRIHLNGFAEELRRAAEPARSLACGAQQIVGRGGARLFLQYAQGQLLHQGVFPHLEGIARPDEDLLRAHRLHG